MRSILIAGLLFAGWIAFPPAVQAQAVCGPRAEVVERLKNGFSEAPVSSGLSSNGSMVEVFATPSGSSWTIVMTRPNGRSCLVAAGEGWRGVEPSFDKDSSI